jgi:hypothetical protein
MKNNNLYNDVPLYWSEAVQAIKNNEIKYLDQKIILDKLLKILYDLTIKDKKGTTTK